MGSPDMTSVSVSFEVRRRLNSLRAMEGVKSIDDLLKSLPRKILISLSPDANPELISQELSSKSISKELDKYVIYVDGDIKRTVYKIIANDKIQDFSIPPPSLEAYFQDIYSDKN